MTIALICFCLAFSLWFGLTLPTETTGGGSHRDIIHARMINAGLCAVFAAGAVALHLIGGK